MAKVATPIKRVACAPALTPDERISQIVNEAVDLVEARISAGTASAQEVVYCLKLGAERERNNMELEKLRNEIELMKAKSKSYNDSEESKNKYEQALKAFKGYRGEDEEDDEYYQNQDVY